MRSADDSHDGSRMMLAEVGAVEDDGPGWCGVPRQALVLVLADRGGLSGGMVPFCPAVWVRNKAVEAKARTVTDHPPIPTADLAAEAIALLGKQWALARPARGWGTDLLVDEEQIRTPDVVIDCKRIPGLAAMTFDPGRRAAGSGRTVTAARSSTLSWCGNHRACGRQSALVDPGAQPRDDRRQRVPRATFADTAAADRGRGIRAHHRSGERPQLDCSKASSTGPGKTVLGAQEIVTGLRFRYCRWARASADIKLGRRKAMELCDSRRCR